MDIYYSRKLRQSLLSSKAHLPPGAAHYSYGHVASKFLGLFEEMGLGTVELDRPEIYVEPPLSSGNAATHFIFKPYHEFRLLKNAHNIAWVAWEFEDLPRREVWTLGDERRTDPFADYVHMLKIPDRIWVGCSFSKEIFARFGIDLVDVVPAPIDTPRLGRRTLADFRGSNLRLTRKRLERVRTIPITRELFRDPGRVKEQTLGALNLLQDDRVVFLLVANPGDLRKNLPALLDGFSIAAQSDDRLVLIVKLTIDNEVVTLVDVLRDLHRLYQNEEMSLGDITPTNVYFTSEFLSADQLQALYMRADFYLSAAIAEGQNLPLQEAMAVGVIPVVGNHTAMAEYVNSENAVLIDWSNRRATHAFERAYGFRNFSVPYIGALSVSRSVLAAAGLPSHAKAAMRDAAAKTIAEGYSKAATASRVEELLEIAR